MSETEDRYREFAADLEKYDEMVRDFRRCHTPEILQAHMLCYVLDMSYPRPDICQAMKTVEREKGWPSG